MESSISIQNGFEELAKQTFRYDKRALGLLGVRTSVVVATILSIPDAVALIPVSDSVTAWSISLLGCWMTALILWFAFFFGFLRAMRHIIDGVQVGPNGVKLWRFGRLLTWDSIQAVEVEDEGIFTSFFSYDKSVKRLTLFTRMTKRAGLLGQVVVPHYIASFFFSEFDFKEMCRAIAQYRFSIDAGADPALLVPASELPLLKKTHSFMRWQRIVLSILIAVSIGMFLSRKAIALYSYNEGEKEFRLNHFEQAEQHFKNSLFLERSFAPAYHGLAGAEFNLGKFEEARRTWRESLKWKPDFVEAKVSLAYMSLQQRDFKEAEKLINSALQLAPSNPTALLNSADLNLRRGHLLRAAEDARLVLAQNDFTVRPAEAFMVTCLLAHGKLLQGHAKEAAQILAPLPISQESLRNGENLTYRLLVGAQINLALGNIAEAQRLGHLAMTRSQNVDTLLVMARVHMAKKEYPKAEYILTRCRKMVQYDPWIYIYTAELAIARKEQKNAQENLKMALQCKPVDALSLAKIASLYRDLGDPARATELAQESLKLEQMNPVAHELLK